ncbi:MAG: ribosome maturation factor [Chitinophagales bacterium]|nr:ribosome maturation factor [Chitinophagales bacterium]
MKITEWLEEKFKQEPEYFLVDVKVQGKVLAVFIEGDNGIAIEKCVAFSRHLSTHLEGEALLGSNYILEVSSPGTENPFKLLRQYKKYIGKDVNVVKFDGVRLDGVLRDADEMKVTLETQVKVKGKPNEVKMHEIPLTEIKSTKPNLNF